MKSFSANRLKEKAVYLGENATTHGVPRLFKSDTCVLKTIWAVCMLLSLSVCAFFLSRNFSNYFSYAVNSQITIITEAPSPFPTVSFCNLNSLVTPASLA